MKRSILYILIILALHHTANGQQEQSYTINYSGGGININTTNPAPVKRIKIGDDAMEFTYDYIWVPDTTDISVIRKDVMLLQVGYGVSKFFSYRTMQADSLLHSLTADEIIADPGKLAGGETFAIYKNYPSGKFTYTDKISMDNFSYEEDIPIMEWTLTDGEKEIEGYKCRRGECDFRGRRYVAWYTDEIPVADGPWKFGGLPGFIMEVGDTEGHYSFVLTGIRNDPGRGITIPDIKYHKTSRDKFLATRRKFDSDPIGYTSLASNVNIIITTPDGQQNNRAMEPKVLLFDYLERDYR